MRRSNSLLAFAVLGGVLLHGQEGGVVFRADTRLVVLHASVVDRNGKLLTNLPRNAFRVYEDNVEQQIKIFRREDVPVSMGLVIDNSGSMRDKRQKVEAAALQLVKASNPQDEVFIVNFNDDAYLDVDFTSDMRLMEEGLARIDSRGGTAMRDAILLSLEHLREKGKHDKKVLFVVTDGNDNASEITLEKLVQRLQQTDVVVYAIGLLTEEDKREARRARRALDAITQATGGLAFYPESLDEVNRIALQVAHDIRNQYIIAYSPTNQVLDGSYRQIRVTVTGPNRPVVRTRSGYYATPEPSRRPAGGAAQPVKPASALRP
ncbi:MAG: VWA domain-containing protein [Bryobacterales bacterium]|nr:VWA domain-containing protein [Bryobacteraceae bacterium]MDW8130026.1 VWA domain-containing protein [Bryobacterales bacterium]